MRRLWMAFAAGIFCALLAAAPLFSTSTQASVDDVIERLADCQDDEIENDERHAICSAIIDDVNQSEDLRAEALVNRGIVYLDQEKPELALADFEKAVAFNPSYPSAHAYVGEASKALGRLDKALASYDTAVSLDDTSADLYAYRGNVHLKMGAKDKARADFEAALKIESNHDVATAGMAELNGK